jgi:hypothetical protein
LTIRTRASIFKIVDFHNNKSMRGINNKKKNYETISILATPLHKTKEGDLQFFFFHYTAK